jgi:hypothetical protein
LPQAKEGVLPTLQTTKSIYQQGAILLLKKFIACKRIMKKMVHAALTLEK